MNRCLEDGDCSWEDRLREEAAMETAPVTEAFAPLTSPSVHASSATANEATIARITSFHPCILVP
jgi:hypothetical protein